MNHPLDYVVNPFSLQNHWSRKDLPGRAVRHMPHGRTTTRRTIIKKSRRRMEPVCDVHTIQRRSEDEKGFCKDILKILMRTGRRRGAKKSPPTSPRAGKNGKVHETAAAHTHRDTHKHRRRTAIAKIARRTTRSVGWTVEQLESKTTTTAYNNNGGSRDVHGYLLISKNLMLAFFIKTFLLAGLAKRSTACRPEELCPPARTLLPGGGATAAVKAGGILQAKPSFAHTSVANSMRIEGYTGPAK